MQAVVNVVNYLLVTPRAGVWIEIVDLILHCLIVVSLPVRECGLKYSKIALDSNIAGVTPRAGVWIEIHFARNLRLPF